MTPAQAAALEEYRKYVDEYASSKPQQYDSAGNLIQYDLGDTELGNISTDPAYKEHELAALRELEDASQNGFTARDRADMLKTENLANRANRGRIESIRQNMQARGMGGGGLDLVAQMQSAQDANEMEALKALEQEGMMQDRKRQSTLDLGNMSSQLQQRDYQQAANKARARDAINQFNVENRNRANEYNLKNQQSIANQNVAGANDWRTQQMQAKTGMATQNYNAATDDYNQAQMRKMERQRKRAGMASGILGAAGGVAGGVLGSAAGPLGIAAGASAGMAAGSALGNAFSYSSGGQVGRREMTLPPLSLPDYGPEVEGDSPLNDKIPIMASAGEVMIPRSLANDPEGAKTFVAAQMMGMDPVSSKELAGVPPLKASKPMSLSEDYKTKMDAANSNVKSAENLQAYGMLANTIGKGLTDFGNSQKSNMILANRWNDMGKTPEVVAPERKAYDGSAIDRLGAIGVENARKAKADVRQGFEEKLKMDDLDPSSSKSRTAQALAKLALASKAKEAEAAGDMEGAAKIRSFDVSGLSAADARGFYETSKAVDYKDVLNNLAADKRLSSQITALKDKDDKSDRDTTLKLSERYNQDPTTKATAEVRSSWEKAQGLAEKPTPLNDIALVYNFMKANDPGSTVREGEFAMAAKSGSLGDQLKQYVLMAESGKMSDQKRGEMLNAIKAQMEAQERRQLQVDNYYSDIANQYKAKPELVVGKKRSTATPGAGGSGAGARIMHGSDLP